MKENDKTGKGLFRLLVMKSPSLLLLQVIRTAMKHHGSNPIYLLPICYCVEQLDHEHDLRNLNTVVFVNCLPDIKCAIYFCKIQILILTNYFWLWQKLKTCSKRLHFEKKKWETTFSSDCNNMSVSNFIIDW